MDECLIKLENVSLLYKQIPLLQDIKLCVQSIQPVVISGNSGSGKTILSKILAQQIIPHSGSVAIHDDAHPIVLVSQQQGFRTSFSQRSYYQNRYEVNNDQDIPVVADYLKLFPDKLHKANEMLSSFSLGYILKKKLNQLSNGEGKRLQIMIALLQQPNLLILDNPFVGIDKESRQVLMQMLDELSDRGITYVLLNSGNEIPEGCRKIYHLKKGRIADNVEAIQNIGSATIEQPNITKRIETLLNAIPYTPVLDFGIAIAMKQVTIQYGKSTVLNNINWQVNRGEKWLIKGANGSGKSMLLSLINGDNPKAFGKNIILFDQPKGSGESIWDLKNKIGYVSPEMHTHYLRNPEHIAGIVSKPGNGSLDDMYQSKITCSQVIASGFKEEIGFSSSITELQTKIVDEWLRFFNINELSKKPFYQVPLGLQRLLLLARALVRNPALLILDEPCQGLDEVQTNLFKETVEHLTNQFGNTVLYVSHYDVDVPGNITHLLELENGEVKFEGRM